MMKELPIPVKGHLVRAVLADEKTHTRRDISRLRGFGQITEFGRSDTPGYDWHFRDSAMRWHDLRHFELLRACPYGMLGHQLWVRESWRAPSSCDPLPPRSISDSEAIRFLADETVGADPGFGKVRPSMFMPRWASRIQLELTDVRVERLRDISEADALAEGIIALPNGGFGLPGGTFYHAADPRQSFFMLWESINGDGSVQANPWVWVVEFRRIEG
ncbi:hypothetical protein G5S34_17625 [Herbaspirillum frisingense]|uniref:hypothetical protein n=1 Tax=Herbaspirillum frisingense TaxID=92645 RepID=UPI0016044217|nr:hypothetical protein [Herbaspirillum frisingense]QNB08393.1 hypothetical protein G5S34_17625 [Herbaspirillum frisingense]